MQFCARDAARWFVVVCFIGSVVQQVFIPGTAGKEVVLKPWCTGSMHPTLQLLEHRSDAKGMSAHVLLASVLVAQLGLLCLLCGGSRLALAWRGSSPPVPLPAPARWRAIGASGRPAAPGAASLGSGAWCSALGYADWQQLCAVGQACRMLCAEARADGHWARLWEQRFRTPCPAQGSLEAGPCFLSELWKQRRCRTCGEVFRLAQSGPAAACRVHPGVCQQVHFYPASWRFSCCGTSSGSEGCQLVGSHAT